ncbi:minor tail protein [Gordonia phage RedWattleHog]|uniref:Minor tail protein n=1 Tax=Gordonia phage Stormageddon TaxID=2656541 RepID=A0A649VQX3_9CAUD|nr:virion structural protein [Gordonia phage Stormageddon]QGJ94910.1 minor tail protein [Gordonia phage Stormageddon]QLF83554.1 minor tail protein [Gordonia phage RedWattleHog]
MTGPGAGPVVGAPASFKTLVYSPEVYIIIEGIDVSADIVRGGVNRVTGGASSLEFTLSNKGGRYNNKFRRMDRVVCYMKRINKVQVFSGYLDLVPGLQLYPSTVTFRASCTIKRILYMYWDPGLPESMRILNQRSIPFGKNAPTAAIGDTPDDRADASDPPSPAKTPSSGSKAPPNFTQEEWDRLMYPYSPANGKGDQPSANDRNGSNDPRKQQDTGLGNMLKAVLNQVGGWDMDQIWVQTFPASFLGYIKEQMPGIENMNEEAVQAFKDMFEFEAGGGGGGGGGGGDMGDAVFTTIGPPANGSAYSNEEIVWIVTNAGWRGEDVVIGSSIIKAESGGNPGAINTANSDGSVDRGLWQINSIHDDMMPGQNRFDPAVSTAIARQLYKGRGNTWNDWSTLVYHGTAQQHFATFRPLVAGGGKMPPGTKLKSGQSAGSTSGGGAPKPGGLGAGAAVGGSSKPDDKKPAKAAEPYGMPPGTNITYGAPGFPAWCYEIGKQFGVQPSTYPGHQESDRNEPGYAPNPKGLNRGIDWSGPVDKMQKFAEYLHANAPSMPQLEQIIWMNPNTGQKIGWAGNHSDSPSFSYFSSAYGGHQDHVHTRQSESLNGSGSMDGAAGGGGSGGSSGSDRLAQNIFTYMFDGQGYNQQISLLLKGRMASLNDEPLIKTVRALSEAGMREFQSAPNGDFIAFYPDYFGLDNTAPVLKLEDVEIKNVSISINDDALTTHVFTMGASTPVGGMIPNTTLGYMRSPGTVTVEDEWLFKRATEGSFFQSDAKDAKELLNRFGVRPLQRTYPNIYQEGNQEVMLLIAIKLFMQKWAEQYQTSVSFTFMPELYPGMRIELVGHDLAVYVKSVTHTFDYESGFTTSAQVMAPMSISRSPMGAAKEARK